jgi:hypothetical protein
MLTEEKLKIYKRYQGDIDGWARSNSKKEKLVMNDNDWYIIDGLVQDISLIAKGLASKDFEDSVKERLKESCIDHVTIEEVRKLAETSK